MLKVKEIKHLSTWHVLVLIIRLLFSFFFYIRIQILTFSTQVATLPSKLQRELENIIRSSKLPNPA